MALAYFQYHRIPAEVETLRGEVRQFLALCWISPDPSPIEFLGFGPMLRS